MMPAGADPVRKGSAGRVWIAPISFSSLSNVTRRLNPLQNGPEPQRLDGQQRDEPKATTTP